MLNAMLLRHSVSCSTSAANSLASLQERQRNAKWLPIPRHGRNWFAMGIQVRLRALQEGKCAAATVECQVFGDQPSRADRSLSRIDAGMWRVRSRYPQRLSSRRGCQSLKV